MDRIEGGLVLPICDFFCGGGKSSHTIELSGRPISQADLDATTALQGTGWRIDRAVLSVAQKAVVVSHPSLGVDAYDRPSVPNRMSKDAWADLEPAERKALGRSRQAALTDVESWRSKVAAARSLMTEADADAAHPEMFLTWGHDSRMRRYPRASTGPSPQGAGLSRSLMQFSQGVPLGGTGLYWLAVRAGSAAGHDKLSHDERALWACQNMGGLIECANRPFEVDMWWKGTEDPWGLLATCFEFRDMAASSNQAAFRSHLPVNVDGTCNGLQHLSAMGLDPVGAAATNLTANPKRQDIYAQVRDLVIARVNHDAAAGLDVASVWVGKVDRNTVKRATMTTPYGVTQRGITEQLIADDMVPEGLEDDKAEYAAATYLRTVLYEAIGSVVVAARNVMDWLQDTATTLGKSNRAFEWVTPAGSMIRQSYHPWLIVRPQTAFGQITVSSTVDKEAMKTTKQARGAAPNFVHSFDAAHMALTINSGTRAGISSWSMIHDSYGVHAAHMETLNKTLRDEFVGIYRDDWLRRTYEGCQTLNPDIDLTPPPERGTFDIEQVVRSPWFFA